MAGNRKTSEFKLDDDAFKTALSAQFERMKLNSKREVKALSYKVKNKAQEYSPVDTNRLRSGWTNHNEGVDERGPWVDVENAVEYAEIVEYGSRPHEIVVNRDLKTKKFTSKPVRDGEVRQETIQHPGTKPQPMLRPALLEAATEWKPRIVD